MDFIFKASTDSILSVDYVMAWPNNNDDPINCFTWWRHQMEIFFALLALSVGNSPIAGEFPAQRPVTRSFDVFFDLRQNKRLSKQSWGWWSETPSRPLWRHCNDICVTSINTWTRRSETIVVQAMACCLTAPSQCLNQYCLLITDVVWHSSDNNSTADAEATVLYNQF